MSLTGKHGTEESDTPCLPSVETPGLRGAWLCPKPQILRVAGQSLSPVLTAGHRLVADTCADVLIGQVALTPGKKTNVTGLREGGHVVTHIGHPVLSAEAGVSCIFQCTKARVVLFCKG